jgi:type IV secretion system protein VirB9
MKKMAKHFKSNESFNKANVKWFIIMTCALSVIIAINFLIEAPGIRPADATDAVNSNVPPVSNDTLAAAGTEMAPPAAEEKKQASLDEVFGTLVTKYGVDGIGWGEDPLAGLPVQLPSRVVHTDDDGNTVIEIDDPESAEFEKKLAEIDRIPLMRTVDEAAVVLANAYAEAKGAPKPFMQDNGRINFYYGTMNPRIICRPLRLTDIELEPGEQIKNIHISDSTRWSVSGAWSGGPENLVTHIIVKPQLPDIAANLLLHTDRRTYSLELVSVVSGQYMPFVGFIYPVTPDTSRVADAESWQDLLAQYKTADNVRTAAAVQERNARMVDPADIYTDYTVKVTAGNKKVAWKPTSVYDANGKTYIVMPEAMKFTEAPAMFIKQSGKEKLTNYRVHGNVYIVDRLFDIGILTVGKDRVAIYRKSPVGAPLDDKK